MNDMKKPLIRFKGFTEDWEQRKVGDCFTERVESMPDGELISVTINDGIKKFSELGRHDNSNDDKSKYKKVCVGDIAYNSMRMWQGASGYSPYEGIVSPAYTVLSPNSGINSKCLAYQFKLPEIIHTFQVNSQGITSDNWNLKYPALSQIEIFVSKDEQEQAKIAKYFENLDNLITLHQRKYDKLINVKKAMLEKMFPREGKNIPEIRFSGFTETWEQRKLGEIVDVYSGRDYKHLSDGDIPVYGTGGYMLSVNQALSYDEDAIGIGRKGTIDKPYVLKAPFWTVDTLFYVIPRDKIALNFAFDIFQNIDWKKKDESTGVPSLSKTAINEIDILIPKYEEQQALGKFFYSIDHLITLHQREVEKLKNIKKSCLEKMFV
ncbi:restriction endonuclease subunit S [Peptostreptococcus porci]|uniref:restriction endonuclease subunit S n=1 Tax=Peptostreptococcus porci TaxID=2652282 RepID=UPI002A920792|nr:restriction endonuclease subunit S [Peptostreptococcus porci]MDY6232126.1 restriction endonuclease subunit S [Peptostreptococcus porci]